MSRKHSALWSETIRSKMTSVLVLGALLIVWSVVTTHFVRELVFPSPISVLAAIEALGTSLLRHSLMTLGRVVFGLAIGAPLGVLIGLAMSWNATTRAILHPVVEIVRPLPPTALIPFFIIWFGIGMSGQVALIAISSLMVLAVQTATSVQAVPLTYVRAAISLGASRAALFRTILFPAITPSLVGALRIAAALAFAVGIAAEFMGAQSGIGFLMMVARRTLETNTILLGIILIALESFVVDWTIRRNGAWLCRWSETPLEMIERSTFTRT